MRRGPLLTGAVLTTNSHSLATRNKKQKQTVCDSIRHHIQLSFHVAHKPAIGSKKLSIIYSRKSLPTHTKIPTRVHLPKSLCALGAASKEMDRWIAWHVTAQKRKPGCLSPTGTTNSPSYVQGKQAVAGMERSRKSCSHNTRCRTFVYAERHSCG